MNLAILGATGKLGRVVTRRALDAGHTVRAFVRTPDKLGGLRDEVEVVPGDLADPESVDRAIEGADAVVSCVGPGRTGRDIPPLFEEGMRAIVAAMERHGVRRIVVVSGAATDLPRDERGFGNRMMIGLMGLFMGSIIEANRRMIAVLQGSDVEWVAARSGNMTDGPGGKPVKAHATTPQGWKIDRVDLADFMLEQLTSDEWVGQAPFATT